MSFGKKLTHIFNRAVTHGAYCVGAAVLTVGIGIGVATHDTNPHATKAPVQNVQLHEAAVNKVLHMGDDILAAQYKLDVTAKSIEQAQANLGKGAAKMSDQFSGLQQAIDQNVKNKQDLHAQLSAYRKELLFDPALPEKEADALYTKLFYATADGSDTRNFFSPFTDALAQRDETVVKMGLGGTNPATVSDAAAEAVVTAARQAAAGQSDNSTKTGFEDAAEVAGLLFGLTGIGFALRRREERAAEDAEAKRQPAPTTGPEPLPHQDNEAPKAETPAPAKPATGFKL